MINDTTLQCRGFLDPSAVNSQVGYLKKKRNVWFHFVLILFNCTNIGTVHHKILQEKGHSLPFSNTVNANAEVAAIIHTACTLIPLKFEC